MNPLPPSNLPPLFLFEIVNFDDSIERVEKLEGADFATARRKAWAMCGVRQIPNYIGQEG